MALDLTPKRWWHCLHHVEWITISFCFGAVAFPVFITDVELSTACLLAGMAKPSDRFDAFVNTYTLIRTEQPLPPPLDVVWYMDSDLWEAMSEVEQAEGDPVYCECEVFAFKGNQGGAMPECWP